MYKIPSLFLHDRHKLKKNKQEVFWFSVGNILIVLHITDGGGLIKLTFSIYQKFGTFSHQHFLISRNYIFVFIITSLNFNLICKLKRFQSCNHTRVINPYHQINDSFKYASRLNSMKIPYRKKFRRSLQVSSRKF